MATTTTIKLGRKAYRVVHDDQGVIRIEYTNAVLGDCNLYLDGAIAKKVLAEFTKSRASANPTN
ncbi:hypothetical protein QRD43_21195 [Pelomonas sp. APW6]|uniref:Uncharacterized protein n=1 Tax=Roseateles subflavus TaxID=3053353 RepID=A0ABT7LNI1_9BURK|nr:hypothetical protein [Pelomonas sp. APW6]MDL5034433.1 hypothetical protein [Pelomonas sp. APW6]